MLERSRNFVGEQNGEDEVIEFKWTLSQNVKIRILRKIHMQIEPPKHCRLAPFRSASPSDESENSLFSNSDFFPGSENSAPEPKPSYLQPRQGFESALFLTPPKITSKLALQLHPSQQHPTPCTAIPQRLESQTCSREPSINANTAPIAEEELAFALSLDLLQTINGNSKGSSSPSSSASSSCEEAQRVDMGLAGPF